MTACPRGLCLGNVGVSVWRALSRGLSIQGVYFWGRGLGPGGLGLGGLCHGDPPVQ